MKVIPCVSMKVKGQKSNVTGQRSIVYVGLSGGVDSSVSAALLQRAGFDVTGVFIKVWSPDFIKCTWREDRLDAMRVCAKLGIPFKTLDLEKEYKREVVDYMIREYKAGRTPNPDVMCNQQIKFGAFFDWAMKRGASVVATGHYARVREIPNSNIQAPNKSQKQNSKLKTINYKLLTSADSAKDQSYFLWTLGQKQLSKTLFPIGHLQKSEVRKLAEKFDLITATKKDSQGLCFIGKVDMKDFLKRFIKEKPGKVLNTNREVIGKHGGAVFYTLGERHGFEITKMTPDSERLYVVAKNLKQNTITVSDNPKAGDDSFKIEYRLTSVNWITGEPKTVMKCQAQIRYHGEFLEAEVEPRTGKIARIKFAIPQLVASGQSIVFYNKNECLGGGVVV